MIFEVCVAPLSMLYCNVPVPPVANTSITVAPPLQEIGPKFKLATI